MKNRDIYMYDKLLLFLFEFYENYFTLYINAKRGLGGSMS